MLPTNLTLDRQDSGPGPGGGAHLHPALWAEGAHAALGTWSGREKSHVNPHGPGHGGPAPPGLPPRR